MGFMGFVNGFIFHLPSVMVNHLQKNANFICMLFFAGPLILCTFMATILQGSSSDENDGGPEFAQVFVIVWIGAMIVTLNSKLLGGNMLVSIELGEKKKLNELNVNETMIMNCVSQEYFLINSNNESFLFRF